MSSMPATTSAAITRTTDHREGGRAVRAAFLLFMAVPAMWSSSAAGEDAKHLPFGAGERLVYDITWMGVHGGEAVLRAWDDGPVLTVSFVARSIGWVRSLYRVDDNSLSFFDTAALRSGGVDIRISEGSYTKRKRIEFDHGRGVAIYRVDDEEPKEYPIDPGTHDAFSVMYAYRAARERVRVGEELIFPVFDDRKKYALRIHALRRERILLKGGYVNTVVAEPSLMSEGIFQRRGKMTIWFSDDKAFAPVMMRSKIILGSFWATLREWSGADINFVPAEPEGGKSGGSAAESGMAR